jgi:hypothetical protein
MRMRAGAVVGVVGWIRTSAPYGWLGSSDEPLSWMVSGNSRPLTAKYRSWRAFTSYAAPVSTAWCRSESISLSSSRYSRDGSKAVLVPYA